MQAVPDELWAGFANSLRVWDALQGIDIFWLNVRAEHGIAPFISERLKECPEAAGVTRGMTFLRFRAYL